MHVVGEDQYAERQHPEPEDRQETQHAAKDEPGSDPHAGDA